MEKGSSTPLQPAVPLEDPPRETGRPGSDAWTPDPAAPGGTPARGSVPPGAPGTEDGTRQAADHSSEPGPVAPG
jgi:hypothetical protein